MIHNIAGESGNALHQNEVNLSIHRVLHHLHKSRTLLCIGAADAVIRIDPDVLPVRIALDVFVIIFLLDLETVFLIGAVGTDTFISPVSIWLSSI